jgi:hypothetical protein
MDQVMNSGDVSHKHNQNLPIEMPRCHAMPLVAHGNICNIKSKSPKQNPSLPEKTRGIEITD